jgi:hypothetical protein
MFSEYVRFNPLLIAAPSRVTSAELAARGNSLTPLYSVDRCSKDSIERRGLGA